MRVLALIAALGLAALSIASPVYAHPPPDLVLLDAANHDLTTDRLHFTGATAEPFSTGSVFDRLDAGSEIRSQRGGQINRICNIATTSRLVEPG